MNGRTSVPVQGLRKEGAPQTPTVSRATPDPLAFVAVSRLVAVARCERFFTMDMRIPKKPCRSSRNRQPSSGTAHTSISRTKPPKSRTVDLQSDRLGLRGRVKMISGGTLPMIVRMRCSEDSMEELELEAAAYCLLLEELGHRCSHVALYLTSSGETRHIPVTRDGIRRVKLLNSRARRLLDGEEEPQVNPGHHCRYCRFRRDCPALKGKSTVREPAGKAPGRTGAPLRPVTPFYSVRELLDEAPEIPDTLPLYVQVQGSQISRHCDEVVVCKGDEELGRTRITDISHICIMGNVQITTQCLRKAMKHDVPVVFFTRRGYFNGIAKPVSVRNAHYRRAQFLSLTGTKPVEIARALVAAKTMNLRSNLRGHRTHIDKSLQRRLRELADRALCAGDPQELLGLEGAAAALYFSEMPGLLDGPRNIDGLTFERRSRQPPEDPVNAMLSFGYGLLTREVTISLESEGLDSMQGFYHTTRSGRPALALDLMEPLRPVLVDSLVISMVRRGQVRREDFLQKGRAVRMTPGIRRKLISSWEKRLQQPWSCGSPPKRTDCRGMIRIMVRDLVAFLLDRKDEFRAPVFR